MSSQVKLRDAAATTPGQGPHTSPLGAWGPGASPSGFAAPAILESVARIREPHHILWHPKTGQLGVGVGGEVLPISPAEADLSLVLATLPPLYPEWLGDRSFGETHRVRFPYIAGAMANGIATTGLVAAMARAHMLGFFGAAGLGLSKVEDAIEELAAALDPQGSSWGVNLIHSPNEPELEEKLVELYLRRGVRRVSASAYMMLNRAVVRYAVSGLSLDPSGRIRRETHLLAKISRSEVAERFMSPAPDEIVATLLEQGKITSQQAELSRRVPVAEDITVESDSGGHTDNQPLTALFPIIATLRDTMAARHGFERPVRVGAAGGLGTPASVAAAFSLGAAYVLTGSVNQGAVESGLSESGRELLSQAQLGDFMMAPSADMFELGVKVQVLKRGTLFGSRAKRLYELFTHYDSLEALPAPDRERLESGVFGASCDDVWRETKTFWNARDPKQLERAEREPKHKMSLCFRWYLGLSSRWAIVGTPDRRVDYQIWCGPAMAAFNDWARGSSLEDTSKRSVVQIAYNFMEGAAVITRAHQLRSYGVPVPAAAFQFRPRVIS